MLCKMLHCKVNTVSNFLIEKKKVKNCLIQVSVDMLS